MGMILFGFFLLICLTAIIMVMKLAFFSKLFDIIKEKFNI